MKPCKIDVRGYEHNIIADIAELCYSIGYSWLGIDPGDYDYADCDYIFITPTITALEFTNSNVLYDNLREYIEVTPSEFFKAHKPSVSEPYPENFKINFYAAHPDKVETVVNKLLSLGYSKMDNEHTIPATSLCLPDIPNR